MLRTFSFCAAGVADFNNSDVFEVKVDCAFGFSSRLQAGMDTKAAWSNGTFSF
jgi:hypothetical protein